MTTVGGRILAWQQEATAAKAGIETKGEARAGTKANRTEQNRERFPSGSGNLRCLLGPLLLALAFPLSRYIPCFLPPLSFLPEPAARV